MELSDLTPYEKLKSLGHSLSQEFCLFPTLILNRLVNLPEILNTSKSVQEHLDYDPVQDEYIFDSLGFWQANSMGV